MRIIHVVQTLDPATGGPPAVALRLAAAQAGQGCDVAIAAYSPVVGRNALAASMDGIPGMAAVRIYDLGSESAIDRVLGRRVYKLLVEMFTRDTVVHLHGVWDPVLRTAAAAAIRKSAVYVQSPHGMLDPWSLGQKYWKKRLALLLGYRKMIDTATFIHYLNKQESELAGPLAFKAPNEIIPNGIFVEEMPAPRDNNASAYLDGKPYILFLSRLHYKKGLDILADAFIYVALRDPDINLVVVGPDGGAQNEFEERIRMSGFLDRVHIVGPLYGMDKYSIYRDAAIFCLPSRQEGFSMAIIEAMGCGLPVVISRHCNFPEIDLANAGAVVDLEPERIGGALLKLLKNPVQSRQTGERGKRLVKSEYTWPSIAVRMIDAYRRHMLPIH